MKIVILNGSHREGNTYNFSREAEKNLNKKHKAQVFDLIKMDITPCVGCLDCEDEKKCPIAKDKYTSEIMPALMSADLIIFATPVYFNMPSAAMVSLINRTNNLCGYFSENPKKAFVYLVGQTDAESMKDAHKCLQTYFEIMGMEEITDPIIEIARMPGEGKENYVDALKNI